MDIYELPEINRGAAAELPATINPIKGLGSEPFGVVFGHNPFDEGPPALDGAAPGRHAVMWSGWFGGSDSGAGALFDPRLWSDEAWEKLWSTCEAVVAASRQARARVLVRPRAGHVLGDPTACLKFLGGVDERGWVDDLGILLDPAGFLTEQMVPDAADHLRRAFEFLAERADGLVLANIGRVEGGGLGPAALDRGLADLGVIRDLVTERWAGDRPLFFVGPDAERQAAAMGLA